MDDSGLLREKTDGLEKTIVTSGTVDFASYVQKPSRAALHCRRDEVKMQIQVLKTDVRPARSRFQRSRLECNEQYLLETLEIPSI